MMTGAKPSIPQLNKSPASGKTFARSTDTRPTLTKAKPLCWQTNGLLLQNKRPTMLVADSLASGKNAITLGKILWIKILETTLPSKTLRQLTLLCRQIRPANLVLLSCHLHQHLCILHGLKTTNLPPFPHQRLLPRHADHPATEHP